MKNVVIVLLLLLVIGGAAGTLYFYKEYDSAQAEKSLLVQQNGELQVAIDAIGPITQVWTVNTQVLAGSVVKEEELVQQTIPVSSITESFVMNKADIVGKYYKVNISPGASITKDILMQEELSEITYERDMSFNYLPLGIKVGDYVDVRIVLPYGEEFIVLRHQRVQQLVEDQNTIKLILNEAQLALWTSALKDYALYKNRGVGLYVTKYIEPGITEEAVPFYPIRKEMEGAVLINPNIKVKSECINTKLREEIETMIASVLDIDAGYLSGGVTEEASNLNSSKQTYFEKDPTAPAQGGQGNSSDDDVIDLSPTDPNGNSSSVSDTQIQQSGGDNAYSEEDTIN